MCAKYLFTAGILLFLTFPVKAITLNEQYDGQEKENVPVVYELPDDADKVKAIAYVRSVRDSFYKNSEVIDAKEIQPEILGDKLKRGFVLYSVFSTESSLLQKTMQPLPVNWQGNTLTMAGNKFSSDGFRFIFVGKNPYSDGFCSVYAASTNEKIVNINSLVHGPRSYHLYDGVKRLDEGDYDGSFLVHPETKVTVPEVKGRAADWAKLQRDPESAQANLQYGQALADDGDYTNAIAYLQKAVRLDVDNSWIKAWALNYLGQCYFSTGERDKSQKALLESAGMKVTPSATNSSEKYYHLFGYDALFKSWDVRESDHFVFHFQTPSAVTDKEDFINGREAAFAVISAFFENIRLPFKIHYFVWNSKADALNSVGFKLGFAVTSPAIIETHFDESPGHEMTHVVEAAFANNSGRTMLVNEGIAVYLNQVHGNDLELAKRLLRSDNKDKNISVKDIWRNDTWSSDYYSLAGAFMGHLLEWGGKEKLLSLMRRQSYEEALKIYGPGLDSAISDFESKLAVGLKSSLPRSSAPVSEIPVHALDVPARPSTEYRTHGNAERLAEFQFITMKLESVYSHLESKQKNYDFSYEGLKAQYKELVQKAVSDSAYQDVLRGFFKAFHDPHLKIQFDAPQKSDQVLGPAIVNTMTEDMILITRITQLSGDEKEIRNGLEDSLKLAKNAKALIVDLRGNGGGNDSLAYDYISKLVAHEIPQGTYSVRISSESIEKFGEMPEDPARPGFSIWVKMSLPSKTTEPFKGPIGVLIDRGCVSSCEGTAVTFKFSGAATLYGSRTRGSSGNPVKIPLPVSKGFMRIPRWIVIMPDGNPIEDHGILPDVEAGKSPGALTMALQDIRAKIQQ